MSKNRNFGGVMVEYAVVATFLSIAVVFAFFGGSPSTYFESSEDAEQDPSIINALNERQQDFANSIYQP